MSALEYIVASISVEVATTDFFIALSLLIAAILFSLGKWQEALAVTVALLGTTLSVAFLKHLVQAPRPLNPLIEVDGYGFPSGHAAAGAFLAVIIIYLFRNRTFSYRVWSYIIAGTLFLALGLSRVYLHVHSVDQIAAGYIVGLTWAFFSIFLVSRLFPQKK